MNENSVPTEEVTAYRIGKLEDEVYKLRKRVQYVFWTLVVVGIETLPMSFETLLDVLSR